MPENSFKDDLKYPKSIQLEEQKELYEKFNSLLDIYQEKNSFDSREFLCYLTSAIFLTYKKLYPQLSIYIPFRTKSDISYIQNIQKEFSNYILDINSKDPFDIFPIIKDISGIRVVLDNFNFTLPPTEESTKLFQDMEIKQLLSQSQDNFELIKKIDDYLQSPIQQNGKNHFELKIALLKKIIEITPPEFTEERKPYSSYSQLLKEAENQYKYFLKTDSFSTSITESSKNELVDLLTDFRSKVYDPLQFAVLRKTLPVVFEDPLISNALQTSFSFSKEAKKENAFQSLYYIGNTPFGPLELQAQSNRAFYTAVKGSAYHSGLSNKLIDIKKFFELVNPNDEHDLSYYLEVLDSTSADSLISPYELPQFKNDQEKVAFYNTSKGNAFLKSENYREMTKHIRIKDKIELQPEFDNSSNQMKNESTINTNYYLFSTALALSPHMNICSSGHTSFTNAGIHHKKLIGEFSEVLRKRDSNTILRDLLIRRLELLVDDRKSFNNVLSKLEDSNIVDSFKNLKELANAHDRMVNKLPKDISLKNIIAYVTKLRLIVDKRNKKKDSDLTK